MCGSASGKVVPPLVMFPYKRLPGVIAAALPKGYGVGHSDHGWMTGKTLMIMLLMYFTLGSYQTTLSFQSYYLLMVIHFI